MAYNLSFLPDFEHDLEKAFNWYQEEGGDLIAYTFLEFVLIAINQIENNPKFFERYRSNFRKCNLNKFPYKILFKVKNDEVVIFAIFHHKRTSKTYLKRKL
jgi:plasmid stabilization system protein ParE